jgi:ankyrin repeat protein
MQNHPKQQTTELSLASQTQNGMLMIQSKPLRNLWDELPLEIQTRIMKKTDLLTKIINGLQKPYHVQHMSEFDTEAQLLWKSVFETDYAGDFTFLPLEAIPRACLGLMHVRSREMYERLCKLQPKRRSIPEDRLERHNCYTFEYLAEFEDNETRQTFLHIAMRHMWLDVIGDLCSRFPITFAKYSLAFNHAKLFKYLVETYQVDSLQWHNENDDYGLMQNPVQPLRDMCLTGDLEVIKFMVDEKGFKVTEESAHAVCKIGHLESVRYLAGAAREQFTATAVDIAAKEGHLEVVKFLCEDLQLDVGQGFSDAISNGHFWVFNYLFSRFPKKIPTSASLYDAVKKSHLSAFRICVKHGRGRYDVLMARAAAASGTLKLLESIFQRNPNLINIQVLSDACASGHLNIVKFIHENCPNLSPTPDELDAAISNKHFSVVQYLIEQWNAKASDKSLNLAVPSLSMIRFLHNQANTTLNSDILATAAGTTDRNKVGSVALQILDYCEPFFPEDSSEYQKAWSGAYTSAIQNGNLQILEYLENKLQRPPSQFLDDMAYWYAAKTMDLELVTWVWQRGMNSCWGKTVMGGAVESGHVEYVRRIYDIVNSKKKVAAKNSEMEHDENEDDEGNEDGEEKEEEDEDEDQDEYSPFNEEMLESAIEMGNLELVQFIVEHWKPDQDVIENAADTASYNEFSNIEEYLKSLSEEEM